MKRISLLPFVVLAIGCEPISSPDTPSATKQPLGTFGFYVNPDTGTFQAERGTTQRGLEPLNVVQNEIPNAGPNESCELNTLSAGADFCGADTFGGNVEVNCWYSAAISNVTAEITTVIPPIGHDVVLTDPPIFGLSNTFGIHGYPQGGGTFDGTARGWCYETLAPGDFAIRGVLWGDLAGITGWDYRRSITLDNETGATATNVQVLLVLDTATPIGEGKMQGAGEDIRFTTSDASTQIPYWIESGSNTAATRIWVQVPSIPAGGATIYYYYGNPGATLASNFGATFPGAFTSSGDFNLSGAQQYDSFYLQAGHTLTVDAETPLVLTARRMIIEGQINASTSGYIPPGNSSAGSGPGGGNYSTGGGAAGGGYGGAGGDGGYDSSDPIAIGGVANGDSATQVIDMGSSGGSSDNALGGAGGGAVTIEARHLDLNGGVSADGEAGSAATRCSGGGAGGGVMIRTVELDFTGTIVANGGNGGSGSDTANDGGGGGGGGRIKAFYETFNGTGGSSVNGGAGGQYGGAAHGSPGVNGSTHFGAVNVLDYNVTGIGAETAL